MEKSIQLIFVFKWTLSLIYNKYYHSILKPNTEHSILAQITLLFMYILTCDKVVKQREGMQQCSLNFKLVDSEVNITKVSVCVKYPKFKYLKTSNSRSSWILWGQIAKVIHSVIQSFIDKLAIDCNHQNIIQ